VTRHSRPVRPGGIPALAAAIALVLAGCADLGANPSLGPAATPIGSIVALDRPKRQIRRDLPVLTEHFGGARAV